MLPTQKTPPKTSLQDLTVLLYSPYKYGKSSLCADADNALFLATEAGLNHVEVYQVPISTWDDLLVAAKEIAGGKHPFRTIVIDTVDNAYRMCADHVCQKFKIDHESDLEYGKGYALVNAEFHRVINKLALLPYGLILVSHSQEKEIQTRTGKHTKTIPTLPDKARKLVLGLVDIILFGDLEAVTGADGKPAYRRVLRTKPSLAYDAGDRTRRLPDTLDFSFAAFAQAFAQGGPRAPDPTGSPAPSSATTAAIAHGGGAASAPAAAAAASSSVTNSSASASAPTPTPSAIAAGAPPPPAAATTPDRQPVASRAPTAGRDRPAGGSNKPTTTPSKPRATVAPATAPRAPGSPPSSPRASGSPPSPPGATAAPHTPPAGNR